MAKFSRTWTFFEGKWHEGNVPIMGPRTHGAWLASTVFDGARYFEGVAPDIDLHCLRLNRSAKTIGLNPTQEAGRSSSSSTRARRNSAPAPSSM